MAVSHGMIFIAAAVSVVVSLSAVGGYAQLVETTNEELTPSPYADCSTNFTTLERALYDTGDNRFQIISTFFPARESVAVYTRVNYIFCDDYTTNDSCTEPERWWWTTGTFYFVQSPSVFRFTSLFFVYPEGRIGALNITLPKECANVSRTREGSGPYRKEGMLEILTQRLKLYGQYNSLDTIVLTESTGFFAKAIPADSSSAYHVYGKAVGRQYLLILFYLLTFFLPLIMIAMYVLAYKSSRVKVRVAFTNPRWYPTLASLIAIGNCFCMFVLGMDICALVFAFDPNHFNEWKTASDVDVLSIASFRVLIATVVMDAFYNALGLGFLVAAFAKWMDKNKVDSKDQIDCMRLLYFSFIGPLGCLGSHGCYMVIGWLTAPRHGGAIFLIYTFSFLIYLVSGKLVYQLFEDRGIWEYKGQNVVEVIWAEYDRNVSTSLVKRKFSFLSLFVVIILQIGFACIKAFIIAAFAELPLVGVLEYLPQYMLSLFQIAVLIATVVLSYKYLTGDTPIDRQLLLGALENMKYLKQQQQRQQPPPPPGDGQQQQQEHPHQQILQAVQGQQQQLIAILQQQQQLLQQCLQRRQSAAEGGQSARGGDVQADEGERRPQTDTDGGQPAARLADNQQQEGEPQTDTDVQRAAAILGAIGHKFLFETLPPPEGNHPTLHFLDTDDGAYHGRGAIRDFIKKKLSACSSRRGQSTGDDRAGEGLLQVAAQDEKET